MKISRYMYLSSGLRIIKKLLKFIISKLNFDLIKIFNECKLNISYSRFIINLSTKDFLFNE